jgi:hypothetical protein
LARFARARSASLALARFAGRFIIAILTAFRINRFAFAHALTFDSVITPIISVIITAGAATTIIAATPTTALFALIFGIFASRLTLSRAFCTRLVLARFVIGNHTEIVVSKLQVIFGLHAVTIVLRILRQLLIFVEQLRRISARAAVNPVLVILAALIAVATAPAAIITIIVQGRVFPHPLPFRFL